MVNEQWGRALRDWILFVVGVALIVMFGVKWWVDDSAPDPYLGGIALMLVGFGQLILNRGGPS